METLKKITIIACVILFAVVRINAQNPVTIQAAFDQSYVYEKDVLYTKAVNALKVIYDEKSYIINLRLGWLLYKNGLYTESSICYQKAMNLLPNSMEARLGYVLPQSALSNWDKVIEQYLEILKMYPNNTVYYRLGEIYYNKGNYESAYKYMKKINDAYPLEYDALLYFAWINLKLQKYTEAKELFNRVLLISTNDASALEGLKLIK